MNHQREIIFVYNANSSLFSQVTDYVHKIVAPQTYECNLCAIIYNNLGMKREWRSFIQNLTFKISFLHKDEFHKRYPTMADNRLPAVFNVQNGQVTQIISAEEINRQHTIAELEKLVKKKLQ